MIFPVVLCFNQHLAAKEPMNRIVRNVIVVLLATISCLLVATVLIFAELRGAHSLFGTMAENYIPTGAMVAGLVAAAGFYGGSRLLRLRPARVMLPLILLLGAGTVYLMDSLDYSVALGRPSIHGFGSAMGFVGNALAQSPLKVAFGGSSSSDSNSGGGAPGAGEGPASQAVSGESNGGIEGIGSNVQGMMDKGNALSANNMGDAMSSAKEKFQGAAALGSSLFAHGAWMWLATLQFAGFSVAGILAFVALRHVSYCDECMIFLSKKGAQTRYFNREREIQGSVDEFLSKAKARRFRQSIEAHAGIGSKEKKSTSEFESTVAISRCPGCHRHRLKFTARKKTGIAWKDISMLGYEAFCLEPIDVMRNANPTRIR